MASFPSTTYFFINTWTWGYEDVLKAISHAFHCKVLDFTSSPHYLPKLVVYAWYILFYMIFSLKFPAYVHCLRCCHHRFTLIGINIQFIHMDRILSCEPSVRATLLPLDFMPVNGGIAALSWTSLPTTMEPKALWHRPAKKERKWSM